MSIDADLVGRTSPPVEVSWTRDQVQHYALAVGAGHEPARELAFTTENSAGVTTAVLPTFANILTRAGVVDYDRDLSKVVHAEQSFELPAPLPVEGHATVTAHLSEVWDKGAGALVTTEAEAVDAISGAVLAISRQTVFIREAGGFGGERGPAGQAGSPWERPSREPDHTVTYRTRPEQALLYRLTGDRNPLHSDPSFAAKAGFDRPILHGMCTYGFAGRALLEHACGGDPARFAGMSARFTRPVLPGDELVVSIWDDGSFVVTRGDDPEDLVLDRGVLTRR